MAGAHPGSAPAPRAARPAPGGASLAALGALLLACGSSAPRAVAPAPGFALADVATGLGLVTDVAFLPDGRIVVVEKDGALKLRDAAGAVTTAGSFPVDTTGEQGLLGVVVDPAFATSGRLVVYYSRSDAAGGSALDRQRVASVRLGADGRLDPASEQVLASGLRGTGFHAGGGMAVGPDGRLYVGVGDSGCNSNRPPEPPTTPSNFFATCLTNGNGKILRIALDGSVPADDPLASVAEATACGATCGDAPAGLGPPRRDLFAWGFRNPWRFAFDPATGRLWVGDVGEITYEEITVVQPGRHHGWPWREGAAGWPVSTCRATVPDTGDCVEPAYVCRHGAAAGGVDGDCTAITGGVFLEAPRWPAPLAGRYSSPTRSTAGSGRWTWTPRAPGWSRARGATSGGCRGARRCRCGSARRATSTPPSCRAGSSASRPPREAGDSWRCAPPRPWPRRGRPGRRHGPGSGHRQA